MMMITSVPVSRSLGPNRLDHAVPSLQNFHAKTEPDLDADVKKLIHIAGPHPIRHCVSFFYAT